MKTSTCSICGKPLTDPVSVELGIGPICRIRIKMEQRYQENLFSQRCRYSWTILGGILVLQDEGGDKSLTNDMENALADIYQELGTPLLDMKIIYRDSFGIYDGVRINGTSRKAYTPNSFIFRISFYSVNERSLDKALAKARNLE